MSFSLQFLKPVLQMAALASGSLAAALTGRFLWLIYMGRVRSPNAYADYLANSLQAFWNSLLAALFLFAVLTPLYHHFKPRLERRRKELPEVVFLSIFFAAMFLIGLTTGGRWGLPRGTWVLAWGVCLLGYGVLSLTRRLEPGVAQKVLYSRGTQLVLDGLVIAAAFLFAQLVRFDGWPTERYQLPLLIGLPYLVLIYLGANHLWGVYSFIWRFVSLKEALIMLQAVVTAASLALVAQILILRFYPELRIPFGVLLMHPLACYAGLLGVRVLRRLQYRRMEKRNGGQAGSLPGVKRILLIGAGQIGARLAYELEVRDDLYVVGFLDDDTLKQKRRVAGIRVMGTSQDLARILGKRNIDEVALCMPGASKSKIRKIVTQCEAASVRTTTVPSLADIVLGRLSVSHLRPVQMEDLLGRDSIEYRLDEEVARSFQNRRMLITGAAGSIGLELTRQLSRLEPACLILLDKDESGLYEAGLEIRDECPQCPVEEVLADIRDRQRLERIFERWDPQVVFHAAAYKHVPMMERDPSEAILTNVMGTCSLVELSARYGVQSFVLISTDKAVNPTSVMGASKRVAEMAVQQKKSQGAKTRFCCVRFGNVLGSRASVVPVFQKRIAQGKCLLVTHPEIRRYFMTIPEAVQLVIQAGAMGHDGEIFLLDMGDPVKIIDLAHELIELSGLVPGKDIPIEITGLRAGEKLYEELLIDTEKGDRSTRHSKIFIASSEERVWPCLESTIQRLESAAREGNDRAIFELLDSLKIGYQNKSLRQPAAIS